MQIMHIYNIIQNLEMQALYAIFALKFGKGGSLWPKD